MKNRNKFNLILFLPCLIAGFFVFANATIASGSKDFIINEIMSVPADINDKKTEWVEMIALNNITLTLKSNKQIENFYLCTRKNKDTNACDFIAVYSPNDISHIDQGSFVIFTKDPATLSLDANIPPNAITLKTSNSFSLLDKNSTTNSAVISYSDDNKATWSELIYYGNFNATQVGHSFERVKSSGNDWQESYTPGGTPGTENFTGADVAPPEIPTEDPEEITELSTDTDTLRINEIFPNPSQKGEANEYIEIYNSGQESVSLQDIVLLDRNSKKCPLKIFGSVLASSEYLLVENKKHSECKISIHNSDGEFSLLNSLTQDVLSTVSFTGSTKEDLSYNFDGSNWRWSKFLTPGTENIFNNLPSSKTEVPKKIFRNTYADFSAKGADTDNDKLKYTWDFGDGHKSYLQETRHKYTKTGEYIVTLKIFDGSEDEIKTFQVAVEKFPELDVNIIGLSPNPAGIDTDSEYILLKNATKKKINLSGWSIATASKKKFINHPITLDLVLAPKQEFKLTHFYSKFSLNNTSAKIELRYPNGKVASKVNYKSPKKSIPDDATYEKIKGGWTWKFPIVPSKNTAPETPTLASNELSTPHTPVKTIEQSIQELETATNLGKFSPAPEIENKKKTAFSLLNFGLHIHTTSAFYETTQLSNTDYPETKDLPAHKHWTVELRDTLFSKTNLFINIFYNNK